MRPYTVLQDYSVPRLNGKDGVVWTEGSTVVLHDDDADWVNRDRPGTLEAEPTEEPADDEPDEAEAELELEDRPAEVEAEPTEEPATTPAAEQIGGRPKGRARRRDSAG